MLQVMKMLSYLTGLVLTFCDIFTWWFAYSRWDELHYKESYQNREQKLLSTQVVDM